MDPVTAAIVSSVIGSAVEGLLAPAPTAPATGIVRVLPAESKTGLMQPPANGEVRIDRQTYLLSPGVVIRNELNMIVPAMMIQAPTKVRYQTDAMGAVNRIWILSAAEAALVENR